MPSNNSGLIWPAAPHTIAKIQILTRYLNAYFPILGRARRGQDILIVDGFAGPGEYENYSYGSPLAVMAAARSALQKTGTAWVAGKIHLAFMEEKRARYDNLLKRLAEQPSDPHIVIHTYHSTFELGMAQLREEMPLSFDGRHPLFVFIDPFGATGAPFSLVKDILSSPCSEVLINLDADGIGRILRAGEISRHKELLTQIYGDDSWEASLDDHNFARLCMQARDLYLEKLRGLPHVDFAFPFEMLAKGNAINYYLIFASQHYLGLEKMKEAMKGLAQDGDYRFADVRANSPQGTLFRFDEPEHYALKMREAFTKKTATYIECRNWALNQTPFVNPKKILASLERNNLLTVKSKNPKRHKGTFDAEKTISITFL